MKSAYVISNGVTLRWEYKSKAILLRWLAAAYGDNYKIL